MSIVSTKQDGLGGAPGVNISTISDPTRSNLELDITLSWTIHEALSLGIDLEEILAGVDSSGEIATFLKGLVTFNGGGLAEIDGSISFTLGIGLEYSTLRATKLVPYVKGNTGLVLGFSIDTQVGFACTIGPFGADVAGSVIVDNLGKLLSISFGLNKNLNYYLSNNTTLARNGFVTVPTIGSLVDQFNVAIAGRVDGELELSLRVPPPSSAHAYIRFGISDINLLLDPVKRKNAFAIVYEVEAKLNIPSFIGTNIFVDFISFPDILVIIVFIVLLFLLLLSKTYC